MAVARTFSRLPPIPGAGKPPEPTYFWPSTRESASVLANVEIAS
jgi:hypothetical protein